MADRIILHSDLNCFYASVEVNENPKLRDQAIAVCGSTEERHGIVLTASYPAKRRGVKTGMANWQAVRACPGLICVMDMKRAGRKIFLFCGLDLCALSPEISCFSRDDMIY